MPNGRRKVPFSAKQKKLQLQNKRGQKQQNASNEFSTNESQFRNRRNKRSPAPNAASHSSHSVSRYRLILPSSQNNNVTSKSYVPSKVQQVPQNLLESTVDKTCEGCQWLPTRPPWKFNMSKQQLESNEHRYFKEFTEKLDLGNEDNLCCYEHNLETWRQLWRVLEMSDILLLIVDIRHPVFNFPPSLYRYICKDLQKKLVLILNKTDLIPNSVVAAWKDYFVNSYPDLKTVNFCSLPRRPKNKAANYALKMSVVAENTKRLFHVIQEIVGDNVNLDSWKEKIEEDFNVCDEFVGEHKVQVERTEEEALANSFTYERFENGVVTVGCVGYPNVGKSSLLNTLMGRKVVSVSRTPGHTKYFQTIFITPTVKLCDCPGLVFPTRLPPALQVLTGCLPISQLRNPLPSVEYLAERINLWNKLKLNANLDLDDGYTALDISEAWAVKKGFYTAKAGRPDTYRASNHILRLALSGEICLFFFPPNYFKNQDYYEENFKDLCLSESVETDISNNESADEVNESSDEDDKTEMESLFSRPSNLYAALDCDVDDS